MATTQTRTFGEFFDALYQVVKHERIFYADLHMEEWADQYPNLENVRSTTLTPVLFRSFASAQANEFAALLAGTCTDHAYMDRRATGHRFMRAIARLGREFGLPDQLCGAFDVPLSPGEAIQLGSRTQQK
jgi:hypothetical protein